MTSAVAPPAIQEAADALGDALARDIAETARGLGVQSMRAAIVRLATMATEQSWSFADSSTPGPDSRFSASPATFSHLPEVSTNDTLVQRLSPRRWAFAWRLDGRRAVLGEVQFAERHEGLGTTETALLRLLCDGGIRMSERGSSPDDARALAWPMVERRAQPRASWADRVLLACGGITMLTSTALCFGAIPQLRRALDEQQQHVQELSRRSEGTISQALARALATGDYGEVQSELSDLQALGYFPSAVVTNVRRQVVAMVGPPEGVQIGNAMPSAREGDRRRLPLTLGSQEHGALYIGGAPAPSPDAPRSPVTALGALGFVASLVLTVLLAMRYVRRAKPVGSKI